MFFVIFLFLSVFSVFASDDFSETPESTSLAKAACVGSAVDLAASITSKYEKPFAKGLACVSNSIWFMGAVDELLPSIKRKFYSWMGWQYYPPRPSPTRFYKYFILAGGLALLSDIIEGGNVATFFGDASWIAAGVTGILTQGNSLEEPLVASLSCVASIADLVGSSIEGDLNALTYIGESIWVIGSLKELYDSLKKKSDGSLQPQQNSRIPDLA